MPGFIENGAPDPCSRSSFAFVMHLRSAEVLRVAAGREPTPTAVILDSRTLLSTPMNGERSAYDRAKRGQRSTAVSR